MAVPDTTKWSVQRIKEFVRTRDGHKCCQCGITEADHQAKHDQTLEVHRLLPGSAYSPHLCATLCLDCHKPKPHTIKYSVLRYPDVSELDHIKFTGLYLAALNYFLPADRAVIDQICGIADSEGKDTNEVVAELLRDALSRRRVMAVQPAHDLNFDFSNEPEFV